MQADVSIAEMKRTNYHTYQEKIHLLVLKFTVIGQYKINLFVNVLDLDVRKAKHRVFLRKIIKYHFAVSLGGLREGKENQLKRRWSEKEN